ncbi:unnamed protein product [Ixodes hexagonus]
MGNALTPLLTEDDAGASAFPILDLPDGVVEYALSFVPAHDLVNACRFVCDRFRGMVDGNGLWKLKCERDGVLIPSLHRHRVPTNYYRGLYAGIPYNRNLLELSSRDAPGEVRRCVCRAPCGLCLKQQKIDLVETGVDCELFDSFKPPIEVSEWCAAQVGFGNAIYRMRVELLNAEDELLACYDTGELVVETHTRFRWKEVNHVFAKYPRGVRYISFHREGRGTQFWGAPDIIGGLVRIAPEQTSRGVIEPEADLTLARNCALCCRGDGLP